MKVISADLSDIKIINPCIFDDDRGFFFESYHNKKYKDLGLSLHYVQDNFSRSNYGVIRGLHYQLENPQGKLVTVIAGEVFDVGVDIRIGSPTFGKWFGMILNDRNHTQLYIPPGFAHGFCVLSERADFYYKCTDYYNPKDEYGIAWDDKDIDISWPKLECSPILSSKDIVYRRLSAIDPRYLPRHKSVS